MSIFKMLNSNRSGASVQDVVNAQTDEDIEDDHYNSRMDAHLDNQLIHEEKEEAQYGSNIEDFSEEPAVKPPPIRTQSYNTIYVYTTTKPVETTSSATTTDHIGNYYSSGRYSQKDEYSILDPVYENPSFDVQDPRYTVENNLVSVKGLYRVTHKGRDCKDDLKL